MLEHKELKKLAGYMTNQDFSDLYESHIKNKIIDDVLLVDLFYKLKISEMERRRLELSESLYEFVLVIIGSAAFFVFAVLTVLSWVSSFLSIF